MNLIAGMAHAQTWDLKISVFLVFGLNIPISTGTYLDNFENRITCLL